MLPQINFPSSSRWGCQNLPEGLFLLISIIQNLWQPNITKITMPSKSCQLNCKWKGCCCFPAHSHGWTPPSPQQQEGKGQEEQTGVWLFAMNQHRTRRLNGCQHNLPPLAPFNFPLKNSIYQIRTEDKNQGKTKFQEDWKDQKE